MEQTCKNCSQKFEINQKDQKFYEKIKWPKPTHCPDCRRHRRFALRNELNLHRNTCQKCQKSIISVFPAQTEYTVFCKECWHSDKWDPMDYGKEYDFSRPFFEQFSELEKSIPHFALFQDGENENCEYINYGLSNKSCYLSLVAYCEDVYYSHGAIQTTSSMDCGTVTACELCYDCIDCTGCYNLLFGQDCYNTSDSYFLVDCIGCSNCFCSVGLRNKKFVFENVQLTEAEYKKRFAEITLTNETIKEWKNKLREIELKTPKKHIHGRANENVTGDYIENCKNLVQCFDCLAGMEESAYCDLCGMDSHNVYDSYATGIGTTFSLELNGGSNVNNSKCLYFIRQMQDCEYCQICFNGDHLFGCYGLKHKKYCILNKQYSKEEYEELYPKIIEHMKSTGEYGEFFPIKISPMAYNETIAHQYYPLSKQEALEKGYKWLDPEPRPHYGDAQDVVTCRTCNNQFKLISHEKEFYKKFNLPEPEKCPTCRNITRFKKRNAFKLYDRQCQKCQGPIQTSYSPEQPEIIYCEPCYLAEK